MEKAAGDDHPKVGEFLAELAASELALGKRAAAIEHLERSLRLLSDERLGAAAVRSARPALLLAGALANDDPARARVLATRARDAYADYGGSSGPASREAAARILAGLP